MKDITVLLYWTNMREITSYWFDVQKRQFQTVIVCYVQIPSQLFDLRAVCRRNNELMN
jgi:hypothetical protein